MRGFFVPFSVCVRESVNVFSVCKTTIEQGDDHSALNT